MASSSQASSSNSIEARDNNILRGVIQAEIHNIVGNVQIVNNAETENIQDSKDDYHSNLSVEETKEILKDINRNLKLPTAPWLETGDELLIQDYFIQLKLEDEGKTISLEEIFTTEIYQGQLKRIYIEAPPGFGKTTLAYKLASDWMREKQYIQVFNLAFLVILRYFKEKSVKTMLSEIVKHKEKEKLWELINNKNTLLIFDGLDEIGEKDRWKIINLQFKGTIIITGRTGSYRIDQNEKLKYSYGIEKCNKFWDRHIIICGIEKENRFVCLGRFFDQTGNWEIIRNRIDELTNSLDELFQSPLMLILLAYVLSENPDLNIRNKTDLYKNLINCLVIRSKTKKDINFKRNVDLFGDMETSNEEISETFDKFGLMALINWIKNTLQKCKNFIRNFYLFGDMETSNEEISETFDKFGSKAIINFNQNNLQFESDDTTDKIYEMGFLIKHELNENKLKIKVHYEGLHLSIIEFAIAFSLWLNYNKNGYFTDEQLICIKNYIIEKGKVSLIVPFLCGLMGEEVNELFNQLNPIFEFDVVDDISFLLEECQQNELFGKVISPFINPRFDLTTFPSIEHLKVLEYGLKFQKIKLIRMWSFEDLQYFSVKLDEVTFWMSIRSSPLKPINVLQCKKIIFNFYNYGGLSDDELEIIFKSFIAIDAEIKKIEFDSRANDLIKLLLSKKYIITRVDELTCEFRRLINTEDILAAEQFISYIINHCKLKTLHIYKCSNFSIESITNAISEKSFLKTVHIEEIDSANDLESLVDLYRKKKLDSLRIDGFYFFMTDNPIKIFTHLDSSIGKNQSATNISVNSNECGNKFIMINSLESIKILRSESLDSRSGCNSVIELKLNYKEDLFSSSFLSYVHIQTIHLHFIKISDVLNFVSNEYQKIPETFRSKVDLVIDVKTLREQVEDWGNEFETEITKIKQFKRLTFCVRFWLYEKKFHFPILLRLIRCHVIDKIVISTISGYFREFDDEILQIEIEYGDYQDCVFKITRK